MSDQQFFAIVGVGRSGTTLLMSMLNAHPKIAIIPEIHFVSQYIMKRPFAKLSEAIKMTSNDPRFARLNLTIDDVMKPFFKDNKSFSMDILYKRILQLYASKQGVRIIGDKAPKNIECLPILHRIFKNPKIIHLIRDPRDVYLSRKKADWSKSRKDILQLLAYRSQYSLGRRFGPRLFGKNYLEIHYEKLINKPNIELNRICKLLAVTFDKRMLNFSASARELVFEDEIAWKKEALGPLLKNNMNKWKLELNPRKIRFIEAACSPTFDGGFYKRRYKILGIQRPIVNVVIKNIMGILSVFYETIVRFNNLRAIRSIQS
ncbi:MAG: sulfotransferase [Cellulophaga sp.]